MSLTKQGEFQNLVTTLATEFINLPVAQFDFGINKMLQQIGNFIGADRAYIYHFADDLSHASMMYEWCSPNTRSEIEQEQAIPTRAFREAFERFKMGEVDFIPRVIDLRDNRHLEKEKLIERGIQSRITLPLYLETKLLGSMGFHAIGSIPEWADYTVDLLKIVAEIYLNLLQRKQLDRQVHYQASLLQNVTDSVIATDMDLLITSWNRAAEGLYSYTSEQVIGKHFEDIVQPKYPSTTRADIVRDFGKNQRWEGEVTHHNKDGNRLDLLISISALKDSNQNLIGAVFVNHDITKRKEAEKQAIELAIQAERIQVLEQIISDLSHDIRTPLASINMQLYMLQKNPDPDKQQHYMDKMSIHIQRLTRLIDDILTMSRLDKGANLKFAAINLNALLEDVCSNYDDLSKAKQNTLILDLSPDLPRISGNAVELSRALANLIENAINYTPASKSIVVKSYVYNNETIVEIQDEGIGIDAVDLPNIFERFFRADKARNTNKGGTGLGLAIVKRVIELHDAIIEVESVLEEGSTFTIRLPMTVEIKS